MPRIRSMSVVAAVGLLSILAAILGVAGLSATANASGISAASGDRPAARHGAIRHWLASLTAEQRQCLRDAGITRPVGPLSRPERRKLAAQVRAAAEKCGIEIPGAERREMWRKWWRALTPEQRQCLRRADLTRPWGPLTQAEREELREQIRAAMESCSVTPPKAA